MAHTRQELRQRNKRARRRLWQWRLVALLVLLVFLLAAVILFLRLDRWQLRTVVVRGNQVLSAGELSQAVEQNLIGNYWYLLPRRQRWFYPERAIRESLLRQFPRLNAVASYVARGDLVLIVKEHGPTAIWCLDDPSQCYFVNNQAQVFSPAPAFSRPIYLTVTMGTQAPTVPGVAPFSAEALAQILAWRSETQKIFDQHWPAPVNIFSIINGGGSDYHLTVELASATGASFQVLINLGQERNIVLKTLESLLTSENLVKALSQRSLALEYIDLRFAPKVFYRFAELGYN